MALRADIEAEIGAKLGTEAVKQRFERGWWASIEYVRSGRDIVGFLATVGNNDGFEHSYAQRSDSAPDVDAIIEKFCGEVIDEVVARRRAAERETEKAVEP